MAIEKAGYPDKIIIGMDVAASEFYRSGKYDLDFKSPDDPSRHISGEKLGDLYRSFIKNYPGTRIQQNLQLHEEPSWSLPVSPFLCLSVCLQSNPLKIHLIRMTGRTGPSSLPPQTSRWDRWTRWSSNNAKLPDASKHKHVTLLI